MNRTNTLAAAIGAALTLGYGAGAYALPTIPAPGAIADGFLEISNFTILQGNGALGKSNNPLNINFPPPGPGNVDLNSVNSNAQTTAALSGFAPTSNNQSVFTVGGALDIQSSLGVGYVARNILNGPAATSTFSGGSSKSDGNALDPFTPNSIDPTKVGDLVPVDSQVSLNKSGITGNATARQNLLTEFLIKVGSKQTFELSFDARGFLRSSLGQPGIQAASAYSWTTAVTDANTGNSILNWAPNGGVLGSSLTGSCVGALTCTEFADAFNLNQNITRLSKGDLTIDHLGNNSHFEVELTLDPGTYDFSIDHKTSADATVAVVPEPGTLALLGLGLFGVGASRRRKAA